MLGGGHGSGNGSADVHGFVGDLQGSTVVLNGGDNVGLAALGNQSIHPTGQSRHLGVNGLDFGVRALRQHLQLVKSSVLRHIYVPLNNICLRLFAENIIENILHLFVGSGIIRPLFGIRRASG